MADIGCRGTGPLCGCLTIGVIILAVDTATAATSAAISAPASVVSRRSVDAHGHVESLAPMISEVLTESGIEPWDIDVLACGVGPGPFTGLRVGIAQMIAMGAALDRPVVGVCTHDVIAHAALGLADRSTPELGADPGRGLMVATAARRAESFVSTYDSSGRRSAGPIALSNDEVRQAMLADDVILAGDAVDSLIEDVPAHRRGPSFPQAADLAVIVQSRMNAGEDWSDDVDLAIDLDPATARGHSTAQALTERGRHGRLLLPPRPLYLRAPDAVASVAPSTTATEKDRRA